jgi:hypothetical protein
MSVCLLWYLYIHDNAPNKFQAAVSHCPVTMSKRIRNSVRAPSTFAKFLAAILGDLVIALYISKDQETDRAMLQAVGRRPFFAEVQV